MNYKNQINVFEKEVLGIWSSVWVFLTEKEAHINFIKLVLFL